MSDFSAFNVAVQVEQVRNSQKLYFELAKKAKKTKLPADFEAARDVLKTSKLQEVALDDTIKQILNGSAPVPAENDSQNVCDHIAQHIQRGRSVLMDNFGLFGGGLMLNQVFTELNKAYQLAKEGKHDG